MSVKDINISRTANVGKKCIRLALGTTANSQTGLKVDGVVPGFAFEITKIEVFALTVTAAITVDVQITTTSALASVITPVAATPTAGTLATSLAAVRGSATEAINLLYTTDGAGAGTNGHVAVWIRAVPANGEVYAV